MIWTTDRSRQRGELISGVFGPVSDEMTVALTADLYTRLRAGLPPASALAAAQAAAPPEHAVSAANFVCMGAG